MADTLLELHSKKYHSQYLKRERTLLATGDLCESGMFSEFSDRTKYDGLVPTGIYLSHCYKNYHATIQDHFLDKEVKKRGAVPWLSIHASYKEPKHLCQYRGKPLFKVLVTATNEYGEIQLRRFMPTRLHAALVAIIDYSTVCWDIWMFIT
jgi:hypothetical protein